MIIRRTVLLAALGATFVGVSALGMPSLDAKTPPFQCQLARVDKDGKQEGICPGTYVSKILFVTAAGCFDIMDTGPATAQTSKYVVKCDKQPPKTARAVAPHPYYYVNSPFEFGPSMVGNINPSDGSVFTVEYNDIAIVVTEPIDLPAYPALPAASSPSIYAEDSCRMLGFAPFYCQDSGRGCYREGFTLKAKKSSIKLANFCDLLSGRGCYLYAPFEEKVEADQPIMLNQTSRGLKYSKTAARGDAGAGLLCLDSSGKEVLAGIHVKRAPPNTINVVNKLGFIAHFMNLTDSAAIEQSMTFHLADSFRETLRLHKSISVKLENMKPAQRSPIYLAMGGSAYIGIFKALNEWLDKDPDQAKKTLAKVEHLVPALDPETIWVSGSSRQNVHLREGGAVDFNGHATLGEILKKLQ